MTIAKVEIAKSREKAGKGLKSVAGMRKAKKSEVNMENNKEVNQSDKKPSLGREVQI